MGSSEVPLLQHLSEAGFSSWSVSYNRWTAKLAELAAALPESDWQDPAERNGATETYAWVMHVPGELAAPRRFAACRWKPEGEMLWRYAFTACESESARSPREVFECPRLQRDFERHFSEVLSDLDLHHPPCLVLQANRMFYAIASLAHNLLQALKLLRLGDEAQTWRNRTIIRNVITVPATQVNHANRLRLKVCVPAGFLRWWRLFVENHLPKRKRGERPVEDTAPRHPADAVLSSRRTPPNPGGAPPHVPKAFSLPGWPHEQAAHALHGLCQPPFRAENDLSSPSSARVTPSPSQANPFAKDSGGEKK